jgi:plasmid stabilization system protein ParE
MSSRRRSVSGKAVAADPPSHRLRWSKRAEADLVGIDEYISADDPVAAARWIDKLTERARTAALMPYAGRVVPEFRMEALREVLVRSYRIVYRIRGKEVQVITVFEGHRLFPSDVDVDSDTE